MTTKGKIFVAGIFSFTTAHILYISAYIKALAEKVPDRPFINLNELIAFAVLLAVLGVSSLLLKLDMGKLKVLIFVYSAVIMAMLVKAVSLAKVLYEIGAENSAAAVLIAGGAILFVISDAVLSLMLFGGKDNRGMTVLNLSTYFSAQILLASSIYFVR